MLDKLNIIIVAALIASISLNIYLVYWFIDKNYTISDVTKLREDVGILSSFINSSSTKSSILNILNSKLPDLEFEESKSMDLDYEIQIRLKNQIVFYFDEHETLVAVDHWSKQLSPLWIKRQ